VGLEEGGSYVSWYTAFASGGIAAGFRVARPLHVQVIENGVGVNLVGGEDQLEGVGLLEGDVDTTGEGHVLPRDDDRVLRVERVRPDDALPDIPSQSFPHFHAELVAPLLQVALEPKSRPFAQSLL
jgi:hypothetical protein